MNPNPSPALRAPVRLAAPVRAFLASFCLAASVAVSSRLAAQTNVLANPGFENGSLSGWATSYGTRSVVGTTTRTGAWSGKVGSASAIAQTVTGLAPNTTYTVSGWLKAETAGQIAYLGVDNHGGAAVSAPTSLAAFTQKSVTFTTGPSNTSANIYVYQSGAASAYCDDLVLTGPGGTNLLVNPGFEAGTLSGWSTSYGTRSAAIATTYAGNYGAKVGSGGAVAQTVTGLTPNTTYTVTGRLKVETAGQLAYLGVDNYGGSSVSVPTSLASFTQKSVTFTTGPSNTSANVFVYQGGTGSVYCDDLTLVAAPTGDATGTQARRIADCLERFGVNTFSRLTLNGSPWAWGGSQGNYDAATTSNALNYLTAGSGLKINVREYHRDYVGNPPQAVTPQQKTWIRDVHLATGASFSLAIAVEGNTADIPGIVDIVQDSVSSGLNHVKWVEGINEPNTDWGQGVTPVATTASVQASLNQQVGAVAPNVLVAGPSLIFSLPTPDTSLTSYLGAYAQSVRDNSDLSNIHVYPPKSPNAYDGNARGGTLADIDIGFENVLPGPALNTEWHPTLYAHAHKNDPAYAAYWGPIYLLSSHLDFGWTANFWFALFDYNSAWMKCGLFATSDANPYPVANAIRALYQLTGDAGATKRTFTPGRLNLTVTGLPPAPSGSPYAGGRWALFQNSARTYFLFIWNEQNDLSSATVPVTVAFNSHAMAQVQHFNITSGSVTPLQTWTNASSVTLNLNTSLRLLRITY